MFVKCCSPSSSADELEDDSDREYHAAERSGGKGTTECHALYPRCRSSLLDVFSSVPAAQTRA